MKLEDMETIADVNLTRSIREELNSLILDTKATVEDIDRG